MEELHRHNQSSVHELLTSLDEVVHPLPRCLCAYCAGVTQRWLKVKGRFANYVEINPLKQKSITDHQKFVTVAGLGAYVCKNREWSTHVEQELS